MKREKWVEAIRKSAGFERQQGLWLPGGEKRTYRSWPLCQTCGREVQSCEIANVNSVSCDLVAKCHGAEDSYQVVFPFRIEGDVLESDDAQIAIKTALHGAVMFDPTKPAK